VSFLSATWERQWDQLFSKVHCVRLPDSSIDAGKKLWAAAAAAT